MVVVNARVIFCFDGRVFKIVCVTRGFGVTSYKSELLCSPRSKKNNSWAKSYS